MRPDVTAVGLPAGSGLAVKVAAASLPHTGRCALGGVGGVLVAVQARERLLEDVDARPPRAHNQPAKVALAASVQECERAAVAVGLILARIADQRDLATAAVVERDPAHERAGLP